MEQTRLDELKAQFPDQFITPQWVEDSEFLSRFGIIIPGKHTFPLGYLKYSPTDFIVEEIAPDGNSCTIEYPHHVQDFSQLPVAPTYYATLVKCSLTTFQALKLLAQQLGCPEKSIQYAGIKDQRAITAQRISIRGIRPEQFGNVIHPQFFLKDIVPGKGVVTMGDLKGNRFTVFVRTDRSIFTREGSLALQNALTHVHNRGFYNFFYLQRFGTPRLINYQWGKDIVCGNYEKVVHSVLTEPSSTELQYFQELRVQLAEKYGDWEGMLAIIEGSVPESLEHERNIVNHLVGHPDDFVGALQAIEQQSTFWVHAYMSLLFNELISDYLISNRLVPDKLPLPFSNETRDVMLYKKFFERDKLPRPLWQYLRPFPQARASHREIEAKSYVDVHDIHVQDEGIRFSFTLQKGQYATTFFSHLFNLVSAVDPDTDNRFSFAEVSNIPPATYHYFAPILAMVGKKDLE